MVTKKEDKGTSMAIHVLILLLLLAVKAYSQGKTTLLRIDCGADTGYYDLDESYWETDENYIESGTNKQVPTSNFVSLDPLNNLRVFTKGTRNCYNLPTPSLTRYFIRASFYYGNYDGKSKPPTFELEFNGNKWATIETSTRAVQFQEVIHTSQGSNVSVCLVRSKESPFISALEIWPLADNMYEGMNRDLAWIKSFRYNYGADENDWIIGYRDDSYNRVWEPNIPSGLIQVTSSALSMYYTSVNFPPDDAITTAVEAPELSTPINLQFTFPTTNNLNYIALYFTEVSSLDMNDTRYIDLYVNNGFLLTLAPEYGNCSWAWNTTPSNGSLIVQLRANSNSTLPPVISAIEVYTATGDGNPSLHSSKKKNLALIIGLSVGLPLGLLLVIISILFLSRRKPGPVQGQAAVTSLGRPQNGHTKSKPPEETILSSASTASTQVILPPSHNTNNSHNQTINAQENVGSSHVSINMSQPPHSDDQSSPLSTGSSMTASGNAGRNYQVLPASGFNQEELNELLELHTNRYRSSQEYPDALHGLYYHKELALSSCITIFQEKPKSQELWS